MNGRCSSPVVAVLHWKKKKKGLIAVPHLRRPPTAGVAWGIASLRPTTPVTTRQPPHTPGAVVRAPSTSTSSSFSSYRRSSGGGRGIIVTPLTMMKGCLSSSWRWRTTTDTNKPQVPPCTMRTFHGTAAAPTVSLKKPRYLLYLEQVSGWPFQMS
ncbi:uncharacterized protein [Panulirus ornatus]|uniref:uncharacterized protein isoform X1 n=1 Tax=Panulirus ornatus TaxID=150431 RepID=UPI003A845CFF